MGVYTTLLDGLQEVDVVIAGGGTAGCIVASRLADAYPNLAILVIESGRDSYNAPEVIHPLLWPQNYVPGHRVQYHKAVKEEQLAGRESILQVGNTLGGGSAVNLMMYTRPQSCDFDSWNVKGWTAEDLLPYVKKFETYYGKGKKEHHGYSGPIQVSSGSFHAAEGEDDFMQAMQRVGFPEVEDLQDFSSIGVSRTRRYVSPQGRRSDAAHAYLHPRLQDVKHPNLHVLVETQVLRVVFDDRRASGVEFRPNPTFQPKSAEGDVRTVKARKLVVASCGTLDTAPLLERSGIGGREVLEAAGVPIIADLPGVGQNYQDHNLVIYPYACSLPPGGTPDKFHGGEPSVITAALERNDPVLGWNGVDASSKIRPTPSEVDSLGPEFKNIWDKDFRDAPTRPLVSLIFVSGLFGDRSKVPPGQYFNLGVYTAYPYSRGSVHITGRSVDDALNIKTGYLSDDQGFDLKAQVWAYKKQREVARRMRTCLGEKITRAQLPEFAPGSLAAAVSPAVNGTAEHKLNGTNGVSTPADITNGIDYTSEDDRSIEQFLRKNIQTCWHGLGTCKMAPRDGGMGVVDESLGVYGVRGLKVADMSIVPRNVSANTMSTALMIGEKAADVFIMELRDSTNYTK